MASSFRQAEMAHSYFSDDDDDDDDDDTLASGNNQTRLRAFLKLLLQLVSPKI